MYLRYKTLVTKKVFFSLEKDDRNRRINKNNKSLTRKEDLIQVILVLKTSGFTERRLAYNICPLLY